MLLFSRRRTCDELAATFPWVVVLLCIPVSASAIEALLLQQSLLRSETSIVNGSVMNHPSSSYPFFALPTADRRSYKWLGCGASIVSKTFAISSAHCFGGGNSPCSGPHHLSLWIGDVVLDPDTFMISQQQGSDKKSVKLEVTLKCPQGWDGKCAHGEDIVLLEFSSPLPDWVKPVELHLDDSSLACVGCDVIVLGFGDAETFGDARVVGGPSSHLRSAQVKVLAQNDTRCAQVYAGGYGCSDKASEAAATHLEHQICAGSTIGKDSCAGDSGSPVVAVKGDGTPVQVGIVSYGGGPRADEKSGPGRECGDPTWPGVYASVAGLKDFICQHVIDLAGHHHLCPQSMVSFMRRLRKLS